MKIYVRVAVSLALAWLSGYLIGHERATRAAIACQPPPPSGWADWTSAYSTTFDVPVGLGARINEVTFAANLNGNHVAATCSVDNPCWVEFQRPDGSRYRETFPTHETPEKTTP